MRVLTMTDAPPKRADEDIGPYPFCHFVTFPPDKGNRPLRQILQVSCRGGYQPPAVNLAVIVRADNIRPYTRHRACAKKPYPAIVSNPGALLNKGSRKLASPTAERQRAGKVSTTTSLHPRRSGFHQAALPNGSPGVRGRSPGIGAPH